MDELDLGKMSAVKILEELRKRKVSEAEARRMKNAENSGEERGNVLAGLALYLEGFAQKAAPKKKGK